MDYQTKILSFYKRHRRMPNYTEIMELMHFKSRNAVFKLLERLQKKGVIEKDSKGFVIPRKIFGSVKILGTVEAGFPSPADEELVDTITLDEWLIKNKEATYMLKVRGDSMIEAGIMEGDAVLLDRSLTPQSGNIVLAEIDGAWTLKYFKKSGGQVMLLPANKKYKPLMPREELRIAAVVTAVIRKY